MDKLMYETLIRYFKTLSHTGYKSYDVVFKMLLMDFIHDITSTELRYYITNNDIKLMQDLLYQLIGSTCEISFPTNDRCCVYIPCGGEVKPPTTSTTSSSSTPKPITPTTYYTLNLKSNVSCNVRGTFGKSTISTLVGERAVTFVDDSSTPSSGIITSVQLPALNNSSVTFEGIYNSKTGSLLSNSLPYNWSGNADLEIKFYTSNPSSTTTPIPDNSTTTSSTPKPDTKAYLKLKNTSESPMEVTYSFYGLNTVLVEGNTTRTIEFNMLTVNDVVSITITDVKSKGIFLFNGFNDIQLNIPFEIAVGNIKTVVPLWNIPENSTTTSSSAPTSTSTSTEPYTPTNPSIYYGVTNMTGPQFRDTPLSTIMSMSSTKFRKITDVSINEFKVPQNDYIQYLVVPINQVELLYSGFTSGGLTSVYYDSSIPYTDGTSNGAYFSKFTRGGVNANQGGIYNGTKYEVFFFYNNVGGFPELVNIKAKKK